MCVCVCERERERGERELWKRKSEVERWEFSLIILVIISLIVDLSCISTLWSRLKLAEPRKRSVAFFLCVVFSILYTRCDLVICRDRNRGGSILQHLITSTIPTMNERLVCNQGELPLIWLIDEKWKRQYNEHGTLTSQSQLLKWNFSCLIYDIKHKFAAPNLQLINIVVN